MNEGLYRVDLDPETAKDLAQTGATVLMLGVPGMQREAVRNPYPHPCPAHDVRSCEFHVVAPM